MQIWLRSTLLMLALVALAACSSTPDVTPGTATPTFTDDKPEDTTLDALRIHDPFEPWNRGVYRFNKDFDDKIFLPVVNAYEFVFPEVVRDSVTNFFRNLGEVNNAVNGLAQIRPEVAGRAVMRFLINSTVGIAGLFDVAGSLGMERHQEDFGQTLAWWGVNPGPYLVLPVYGPSNARDTTGLGVDFLPGTFLPYVSDVNAFLFSNPALIGLTAVDLRSQIPFEYWQSGNAFEYELVRFLYTKKREFDAQR